MAARRSTAAPRGPKDSAGKRRPVDAPAVVGAPRGPEASVGFLGLPEDCRRPETARVHVLPVPYEETVSYEKGAKDGPAAIIEASKQVELYDPETGGEPALSFGVYTLPPILLKAGRPERVMDAISTAAENIVRQGRLLLALGGEHGITPALVRGVLRATGTPPTIVQIDAHADLRDSYTGTRFSHACAMRRCLEMNEGPVVQLGIRSFSMEEAEFLKKNPERVIQWTADEIHRTGSARVAGKLSRLLCGKPVYLTIDVDGLDPSVIPATGTPEPGGLSWQEAVDLLRAVCVSSRVVAMDCVELAPRPGLHMAEFSAARLLSMCLAWIAPGAMGGLSARVPFRET
jgi:agmatinase